jgi:hypothetical protein
MLMGGRVLSCWDVITVGRIKPRMANEKVVHVFLNPQATGSFLTKLNFTPESGRDSRLLGQLNLSAENPASCTVVVVQPT